MQDTFTQAYLEALVWSETDAEGSPLDRNYSTDDISEESLAVIVAECARFQTENASNLELLYGETDDNGRTYGPEQAGHDFALTRNRHGSGFWNRFMRNPYLELVSKELSDASHGFGESNLLEGEDRELYVFPLG